MEKYYLFNLITNEKTIEVGTKTAEAAREFFDVFFPSLKTNWVLVSTGVRK